MINILSKIQMNPKGLDLADSIPEFSMCHSATLHWSAYQLWSKAFSSTVLNLYIVPKGVQEKRTEVLENKVDRM